MNEEEKAIREFRLYELLCRASLNDSILKRTKPTISLTRSRLHEKLLRRKL